MFQVKCLSVYCGDAIFIQFVGEDCKNHNILIDGGFVKTYKTILLPEINEIGSRGEKIDLLVVSHYDADHIGGISALANDKEIELDLLVDIWWINFDLPLLDTTGAVSIEQLRSLKKTMGLKGKVMTDPVIAGMVPLKLYGGLVTVLSPDKKRYNDARKLIEEEKEDTKIGRYGDDYGYPIENFIPKVIEEADEDSRPSNGSSIGILFSFNNNSTLLMADAFPSVVSKEIRNLGYNSIDKPLKLHSVKLSHHGSKVNISNDLLSLIRTDKFIVSANGQNKHNLPHKETIARILINGHRNPDTYFDFYFTHKNHTLESMFTVDGPDVFEKWRFRVHFPNEKETAIVIS